MASTTARAQYPQRLGPVHVSDSTYESVMELAKANGVSIATVMRAALEEYLDMLNDESAYVLESLPPRPTITPPEAQS